VKSRGFHHDNKRSIRQSAQIGPKGPGADPGRLLAGVEPDLPQHPGTGNEKPDAGESRGIGKDVEHPSADLAGPNLPESQPPDVARLPVPEDRQGTADHRAMMLLSRRVILGFTRCVEI